jgi:hypothetical protein
VQAERQLNGDTNTGITVIQKVMKTKQNKITQQVQTDDKTAAVDVRYDRL